MLWFTVGSRTDNVIHFVERFKYLRGDPFQLAHLTDEEAQARIDSNIVVAVDVEEVNGRFKLKANSGMRIYDTNGYDQVAILLDDEPITRDCIWADTETGEAMIIVRDPVSRVPESEKTIVNGRSTYVPKSEVITGTITAYKIKEEAETNDED